MPAVTVYVDDMRARLGRMKMCHMAADSPEELHAMAALIGVARRHYQGDHYDICLARRALAVRHGAREIGRRELARMVLDRRRARQVGTPECARRIARQRGAPMSATEPASDGQGRDGR